MADTKFTPGPWYWTCDDALWSDKDGEVIRAGDDGKSYGMHSATIEHHYSPDVKAANKALIAAAPELYDALQKLVDRISYYSSLAADERPNIEQWEYTEGSTDMAAARAALAKARGEA